MITSHLMGGLGNQLFQIFTTISYGFTHTIKVVFPYSKVLQDHVVRDTYWDSFLESLQPFICSQMKYKMTNEELYKFELYREKHFSYNILPYFSKSTMLYGYWQSYKYFDDMKEKIFQMIRLEQFKFSVVKEYSRYFDEHSDIISMHFRLGDYKYKQEYHPILPYEYYEKALDTILEKSREKTRVLYFCEKEDNSIVLDHIQRLNKKNPEVLFIKVDDDIPDWKQMVLMSCCNHNIIANSTFSWWGAYMNILETKIVCYPSIWFGIRITQQKSHDEYIKDLYPDSWIKINL